MTWQIKWQDSALKQLRSLEKPIQGRILKYLKERVIESTKDFGAELIGDKLGLWRYRVGDYRIICQLQNEKLIVLVVSVGHRKEVYN